MSEKIFVVFKEPLYKPVVIEIENTLEELQRLVEGYIEVIPMDDSREILMVINEEGNLSGMKHNIWLKERDISKAYQEWWDKLTGDQKQCIKEIPNFDAEKFKQITGIDV